MVYDFFFQYCPAVTLTNSSWWLNFDAGFDYSCSGDAHATDTCLMVSLIIPILHNNPTWGVKGLYGLRG